MKIGLAQLESLKGDIDGNLVKHNDFIKKAITAGVHIICFPELSLTGYEPEIALEMGIEPDDDRLGSIERLSERITIMVGAPIRVDRQVAIGMIIFEKEKHRRVYLKQILHEDEEPYFVKGKEQIVLKNGNEVIIPAICYESLQYHHYSNSEELKPSLYLASVAKHKKGMDSAHAYYKALAHQKGVNVAVVNAVGYNDNFYSIGKSAIWDSHGELRGILDSEREGLLTYNKRNLCCEVNYF